MAIVCFMSRCISCKYRCWNATHRQRKARTDTCKFWQFLLLIFRNLTFFSDIPKMAQSACFEDVISNLSNCKNKGLCWLDVLGNKLKWHSKAKSVWFVHKACKIWNNLLIFIYFDVWSTYTDGINEWYLAWYIGN